MVIAVWQQSDHGNCSGNNANTLDYKMMVCELICLFVLLNAGR